MKIYMVSLLHRATINNNNNNNASICIAQLKKSSYALMAHERFSFCLDGTWQKTHAQDFRQLRRRRIFWSAEYVAGGSSKPSHRNETGCQRTAAHLFAHQDCELSPSRITGSRITAVTCLSQKSFGGPLDELREKRRFEEKMRKEQGGGRGGTIDPTNTPYTSVFDIWWYNLIWYHTKWFMMW